MYSINIRNIEIRGGPYKKFGKEKKTVNFGKYTVITTHLSTL